MLVWEGNYQRPNVFWIMITLMIHILNFHHHKEKRPLLKITQRSFPFLVWVL